MALCVDCKKDIGIYGKSFPDGLACDNCTAIREKQQEEERRSLLLIEKQEEEKRNAVLLAAKEEKLALKRQKDLEELKEIRANSLEKLKKASGVEAIMLTTETAPNLKITHRLEVVTAECAFGMNVFKDLFAGVRDIVGGRSKAVQNTMRDSRRVALYELKKEAFMVGANAVVGVDLDYTEISSTGGNMILLIASGTAVIIDED